MPRDQRAVCFGNRDLRELRTDAAAARPAGSDGGPVSDRAQAPAAQATLSRLGRLAQLGERLPYKQEVGGSIPSPPIVPEAASYGAGVAAHLQSGETGPCWTISLMTFGVLALISL